MMVLVRSTDAIVVVEPYLAWLSDAYSGVFQREVPDRQIFRVRLFLFIDVCCCFGVVAFLGEDLMGSSSILSSVIFVVEFFACPYSCGCISIEDIVS